jgi:hypothetical protein
MGRNVYLAALLTIGPLAAAVGPAPAAADPPPANKENIDAALKLTLPAAMEYEIRVGDDEKPLAFQREPVLKWSNPDRGEVHGNVFLWTRDGRPLVAGSLLKWFRPHTHMSHEFMSLAEEPLAATFHGSPAWKTAEPGVKFADLPGADAPAADEAKRLLQMRQLVKNFSGSKKEREDMNPTELRLLPQPVYRYAAPKQGVVTGGLFALVHGTDPDIWVLVEARGEDAAAARWQFAAARMNSVEVHLRYRGEKVWSAETLSMAAIYGHRQAYTSFMFHKIPDFLNPPPAKPEP